MVGGVEHRAERRPPTPLGQWPEEIGRKVVLDTQLASFAKIEGLAPLRPAVWAWQHGDVDMTIELLRPLCALEDLGPHTVARIMLADVCDVRGDLEDMLLQLRLAADSGHCELAPMAAWALGSQLKKCGDLDGAQQAYQQALDSHHPLHSELARNYLAQLYFGMGETASAEALLSAGKSVPTCLRPWTIGLAGDIRFALGDLDGAYASYRELAEGEPGDQGNRAAVLIAALIDLGYGGPQAREHFARLERSEAVPAERAEFVRVTLERWRNASAGAPAPRSVATAAAGPVDVRWLAYGEAVVRFHRDRHPASG